MYLENSTSGYFNTDTPFYIGGFGGTLKSATIPLYLKSEAPSLGKSLDLFIGNYYEQFASGIPFYLEAPSGTLGAIPYSGGFPMYIARDSEWTWLSLPMYLQVSSGLDNTMTMYIAGGTYSNNSFTMAMSGLGNKVGNIDLMIRGY